MVMSLYNEDEWGEMSHTPEGMKNEGILPKSNKDIYQFLGHIKISFNV